MKPSAADQANQQMVDWLIADGSLWSPALIAAFRATPRHLFLDRVFQYQFKQRKWREVITRDPGPEEIEIVYTDRALITRVSKAAPGQPEVPISSSSQPSLMAQMLEDLQLQPGLRVLEIGAGTGYDAALLAHVVGPGLVTSIDVDRMVLSEAWDHLRRVPNRQVRLHHADGRQGWTADAPYDRIMVTAATPDLEPAWLEQLAAGGMVSAPVAFAPGLAFILRGTVRDGIFHGGLVRAAYFMPLRGENETGEDGAEPFVATGAFETVPAPWADWFDRRQPRVNWLRFSQALAFYGLLHGLTIHQRGGGAHGQPCYGIRDDHDNVCWLGAEGWQVNTPAARDLGCQLYRAFMHAGGPWPNEFRIRASPLGRLQLTGQPEEYVRQGPQCQQVWELVQPRERSGWL